LAIFRKIKNSSNVKHSQKTESKSEDFQVKIELHNEKPRVSQNTSNHVEEEVKPEIAEENLVQDKKEIYEKPESCEQRVESDKNSLDSLD
jgi:hypothetical protein